MMAIHSSRTPVRVMHCARCRTTIVVAAATEAGVQASLAAAGWVAVGEQEWRCSACAASENEPLPPE